MSRDLEVDIRDRLRSAALPLAPQELQERVRLVTSRPPSHATGVAGPRGRLLVPLAAVLIIATAAILAAGAQPLGQDPNAGSQGPTRAALTVDARVSEWCSPGGCAFQVELSGPGGPWRGQLDDAELGGRTGITPGLPELLAAGSYALSAEIHVFGDAIYPGETGPRDLGTTATCTSEFMVTPETRSVAATLGFWLDRCSVGTVAAADPGSLAALEVETTIDGACGDFGCDYRVALSGPGGSWQTVLRSQKPSSQLVAGPSMPSTLAPGAYRLEASSHRMSEEPQPGVGHQQELGVAGTCSVDFEIASDTGSVGALVTYDAERCAISVDFTDKAPEASPGPSEPSPVASPAGTLPGSPSTSPEINCFSVEPVTTCAPYIDAALEALGPDRSSIVKIVVHSICAAPYPPPASCARPTVQVTFSAQRGLTPAEFTVRFSITFGPNGPGATLQGTDPRWGPTYPAEPPEGYGVRIESAHLSEDRRTLAVEFYGGGCFNDNEPWVGRAGDELLVSVVVVARSHPPLPSGVFCTAEATLRTYYLALSEPFIGDTVRDLNGGVLVLE